MENISLNYSASDFVQLAFRRCIRVWKFPFMRENMGEILSLELLKFFKGERSLSSYAFLALMHSDTSINTRDTTALDLSFSSVVVHVFHGRGIAGTCNWHRFGFPLRSCLFLFASVFSLLTCPWLLILIYRVTLTISWSCFDGKMTPYERVKQCCLIRITRGFILWFSK